MSDSHWPDDDIPNGEYSDEEKWYDDDDEFAEDDNVETVPCPECGAEVYEESERCPACGNYIVHSTTAHSHNVWSGRPWWWTVLGILGVLLLIWALTFAS